MKTPEQIEELCKKLKPVIGKRADTLWYMYLAEDDLGRKNIVIDLEIIAEKVLKETSLVKQEILLEPPSIDNSSGRFLLGDVIYNRKFSHKLYLRDEDFIKQIGLFGITGEGKTNLAYLLALQLLKSKTPWIVIDWKRSWRGLLSLKDKHPELKKVEVFTVGRNVLPFPWNPFRCPPGADKELWISAIAESLEKSHLSGPGVTNYFIKIYPKLFKGLTKDFYPNFYDGKREIESIRAYDRELGWKQTAQRIFNSFTMGSSSKAFNSRNPIKLEDLLDKQVILELDLEMPKPLRVFFSEMILRWIHLYRLGQGETEKLRGVLFLEECHNLFSTQTFYKENNSGLENIYREIRAFGEGIVSITQHPSMLPTYLLGNCHTQIYLGLQHADDIRTARKSLFLKYDEESYPNMLNIGECIVKIKNRVEPCLVKVPLVPIKKGVVNDSLLKIHSLSNHFSKHAWQGGKSNLKFLRLKNSINRILLNKNEGVVLDQNKPGYSKVQLQQNKGFSETDKLNKSSMQGRKTTDNKEVKKVKCVLDSNLSQLLEDIFLNPFSGISQRYKRLKFSGYFGNRLKGKLIGERCIVPRFIVTNKYRLVLFDLTNKGKMILRDLGLEFKNIKEGIVHKFWKFKIAEFYKKKNFEVLVEEPVNGRADIVVINKGKKVAVEIETGKSDFCFNVKKCLKAGFDEVICVATSRNVEGKIREELERVKIFDKRVRVTDVRAYGV